MSKPKLALKTANGELTLPLSKVIWYAWRVLTYPILITAAGLLFGVQGVIAMTAFLILTNRGEI